MKTDRTFSNPFFGNLSSSSPLTREAQEERSRLSGTVYGDIKVTIYVSLSIGN